MLERTRQGVREGLRAQTRLEFDDNLTRYERCAHLPCPDDADGAGDAAACPAPCSCRVGYGNLRRLTGADRCR